MALTDKQIAQIVVDDFNAIGIQNVPYDALAKAEYWVGRGKRHMVERTRYNPAVYADSMGEEVLIEYVKVRLSGVASESNVTFLQLLGVWQKQAAISYHGSFDACVDADPNEGDEDALTDTIGFVIPIPVPKRTASEAENLLYTTYKDVGRPVEANQFVGWGVVFLDINDDGTGNVESEYNKKYTILSNTATSITFEEHEVFYREVYNATSGVGVKFRIVPN